MARKDSISAAGEARLERGADTWAKRRRRVAMHVCVPHHRRSLPSQSNHLHRVTAAVLNSAKNAFLGWGFGSHACPTARPPRQAVPPFATSSSIAALHMPAGVVSAPTSACGPRSVWPCASTSCLGALALCGGM